MKRLHPWFLATLCLTLCISGCDIAGSSDATETEVKRVSSPDKTYELVSYEFNGGATTAYSNSLYMMKPGEKLSESSCLILSVRDKLPTRVEWRNAYTVDLWVGGKKINRFTNYGYMENAKGELEEIRFVLR